MNNSAFNKSSNNTSTAKALSSNDPRLKEVSQKVYNLLAFRNKPQVIANDLQGYFKINVEEIMKEYGFDKSGSQAFFTKLGYTFDSNGRFILPPKAPVLTQKFRDVLYTEDDDEAFASPPVPRV
uniref:Uncharacterized protein n=1 Tax=Panagrolaimus sp. PS1159 TaxID=55785 RepID=A0AC35EXJ4_9BILA